MFFVPRIHTIPPNPSLLITAADKITRLAGLCVFVHSFVLIPPNLLLIPAAEILMTILIIGLCVCVH